MRILCALLGLALAAPGTAGAQGAVGHEQILMRAGCHEVTYYFHEDGEHDYFSAGKPRSIVNDEYIAVVEDAPTRVVLQHATIAGDGQAIPHWHEVWNYGAGGWTQSVYGRSPGAAERELRSRCTAPWSMNLRECEIGPAPKPFRDSGAPFGFLRDDYDELYRSSVMLVTPNGWVLSQRNRKLTEDGDLVSYELGYTIYRKYDADTCEAMVTDRTLLDEVE